MPYPFLHWLLLAVAALYLAGCQSSRFGTARNEMPISDVASPSKQPSSTVPRFGRGSLETPPGME